MSSPTLSSSRAGDSTETVLAWFQNSRPQLRDDAELIEGLDNRPLVFINETGRYIAVGPQVVPLLALFNGELSGDEIVDRAAGDRDRDLTAEKLAALAHSLRQAGALTEPPEAVGGRAGITRFMRREHLLRLPLTKRIGPVLEPITVPLRKFPGRKIFNVWATISLIGFALGMYSLFAVGGSWQPPSNAWLLYPLLFTQIAFHELAHAMVCQYLRVPVREAGVGLMLYIMPVGYVDRTDAYRVQDRRSRAFIALAGPMNDQIWFGVAGAILLVLHGTEFGNFIISYMALQLLLTIMNFNPFTPSDGYHAVSAMAGAVNFRGQALSYLTHLVLRVPLSPELQHTTKAQRRGFIVYAFACIAFVAVLAWGMAQTIIRITGAIA